MIIITAVGADRPGMAHAVAALLSHSGCNIEDTTMTRLSGEFAMILIVSPPQSTTPETLAQTLAPLEQSHGLFISCRDIDDDAVTQKAAGERWMLSVYGPEKSGLVARVTEVLANRQANITDVQTRVASGGALYVMIFQLELPQGQSIDALRDDLQAAAIELNVQTSLHPLEEDTL
ncbi:MAG TPA: ACT domain-containing protein [Abditibacteriaceae bacterium]|jgi:glycine cleavage system transcriptional repressor